MPPGCLGSPRIELRGLSKVRNIFKIIQLYRANQCLWNPRHKDYYKAEEIRNAWSRITSLMGGLFTTDEIKNVINNLREYYEDESELLEMKKQQGMKGAQPRHIYYYALQFLNAINTNANESDESDNRKPNINSEKKSNLEKRRHYTNIFGRKKSHGGRKIMEKQQSFLFESLSEYKMKQPVPLKCRVHQDSLNNTINAKQKNLYNGMRNPEENTSKNQPVSMFLNSTAFGKPILETGLEKLSFLRDRIDTEKVAAEFVKAKNNKVNIKKFRIYEKEIYPNIFQEVKVPETIQHPSFSFAHLSQLKFNHSVPKDLQSKTNKLKIKLMFFDATTGKLSMLQDMKEKNADFKENTLPSSIPKFCSKRLPTVIIFASKNNLAYQRASSGGISTKKKDSKHSLKSSIRKLNFFKSFSKPSKNYLTKHGTLPTHQLLPNPNPFSVQLLDTKSNESQVEVAQHVFTYVEPEENNAKILDFF